MDAKLFTEGSLYYYENRTNSKKDYKNPDINHDFIVSRPVYILDSKETDFDVYTVNVLVVTSSPNRIGIPININGYRDGKVLPFSIYSLHKENLVRYLGQVSESMKNEIRNAVMYHLGFTEKTPKYIEDYKKFESYRKDLIKNLTPKESTVNNLLEEQCLFKKNYYVDARELFNTYKKRCKDNGYTRINDFNKCITKLQQIYPSISIDIINKNKIFNGVSINGNIHRKEHLTEDKKTKGIVSDNITKDHSIEISEMNRDQLITVLESEQLKIYEGMDILQKFKNRKKSLDDLDFKTIDHYNARIMKRLIEIDIDNIEKSIKSRLRAGKCPYDLSNYDQFIIYHWSNDEIRKNINPKYIKKGVIKLKRSMKQNIQYLFNNDHL